LALQHTRGSSIAEILRTHFLPTQNDGTQPMKVAMEYNNPCLMSINSICILTLGRPVHGEKHSFEVEEKVSFQIL